MRCLCNWSQGKRKVAWCVGEKCDVIDRVGGERNGRVM